MIATLARALGRDAAIAELLSFAWGGWMLIADMGDHIDGYPIVTHHTCDGLLIDRHGDLSGLDDDAVAAVVLDAIGRGGVVRWSTWRDVSDRVVRHGGEP